MRETSLRDQTYFTKHTLSRKHVTVRDTNFGRKPRTTLDTPIPHIDGTELREDLVAVIEQRKRILREIKQVFEKRHRDKVATRQRLTLELRDLLRVCQ